MDCDLVMVNFQFISKLFIKVENYIRSRSDSVQKTENWNSGS